MILRKAEKNRIEQEEKTPIKSAMVRVHFLSQCHPTGHPEEKAGKPEPHGWGSPT